MRIRIEVQVDDANAGPINTLLSNWAAGSVIVSDVISSTYTSIATIERIDRIDRAVSNAGNM